MSRSERLLAQATERCEVVAELAIRMQPFYRAESTSFYQRQHIETVIGAALWYIPNIGLWTGRISRSAILAHHPTKGEAVPKLTQDHYFPRKAAAQELLRMDWSLIGDPGVEVTRRYLEVYGRFNYVTSRENRTLMPFQKVGRFQTSEEAYGSAGVQLLDITSAQLQQVRGRDARVIETLIEQ